MAFFVLQKHIYLSPCFAPKGCLGRTCAGMRRHVWQARALSKEATKKGSAVVLFALARAARPSKAASARKSSCSLCNFLYILLPDVVFVITC